MEFEMLIGFSIQITALALIAALVFFQGRFLARMSARQSEATDRMIGLASATLLKEEISKPASKKSASPSKLQVERLPGADHGQDDHQGGAKLNGAIAVSGSKNATLPILVASLLCPEPVRIRNVPRLRDVTTALGVLGKLGVESNGQAITNLSYAPHESSPRKRRTIWSRRCARRSWCSDRCSLAAVKREYRLPADARSARGRSIFISSASVCLARRFSFAAAMWRLMPSRLAGARVWLDAPSVGATENIMMAAVMAPGHSTIENAAREPEVQDLAKFLVAMGAKITGAGPT